MHAPRVAAIPVPATQAKTLWVDQKLVTVTLLPFCLYDRPLDKALKLKARIKYE